MYQKGYSTNGMCILFSYDFNSIMSLTILDVISKSEETRNLIINK